MSAQCTGARALIPRRLAGCLPYMHASALLLVVLSSAVVVAARIGNTLMATRAKPQWVKYGYAALLYGVGLKLWLPTLWLARAVGGRLRAEHDPRTGVLQTTGNPSVVQLMLMSNGGRRPASPGRAQPQSTVRSLVGRCRASLPGPVAATRQDAFGAFVGRRRGLPDQRCHDRLPPRRIGLALRRRAA